MDDNGNEDEFSDDQVFRLTPQGWFQSTLESLGASKEQSMDLWQAFEGFCIRSTDNPDASHAALIFDGAGGYVMGVQLTQQDD